MIDLDEMEMHAKSRLAYSINANAEYEKKKMQEYFDSLKPVNHEKNQCNTLDYLKNAQIHAMQNVYHNCYSLQMSASNNPYTGLYGFQLGVGNMFSV